MWVFFITLMIFQSDPSATVFNLSALFKKYIAQNSSKLLSGPIENIPKNVYSHIWSHHTKYPKSGQVSTNKGIMTQELLMFLF